MMVAMHVWKLVSLPLHSCLCHGGPAPRRKALINSDWSGSRESGGVCRGGVADLRETAAEAERSTDDPHVAVPGYWLQKLLIPSAHQYCKWRG